MLFLVLSIATMAASSIPRYFQKFKEKQRVKRGQSAVFQFFSTLWSFEWSVYLNFELHEQAIHANS